MKKIETRREPGKTSGDDLPEEIRYGEGRVLAFQNIGTVDSRIQLGVSSRFQPPDCSLDIPNVLYIGAEAPTNPFVGLRPISVNLSQRQGGAVTHLSRRD
jgi:hypothetical protein